MIFLIAWAIKLSIQINVLADIQRKSFDICLCLPISIPMCLHLRDWPVVLLCNLLILFAAKSHLICRSLIGCGESVAAGVNNLGAKAT